jgi:hypothetical protein
MENSRIAKIFQTRYLFSKAQREENKKTSKRKDRMLYKKITHNPFLLHLIQNNKKKVIGNRAESILIFGSTFYKWYIQI